MNLHKKLAENLILHYVEANNWGHDEEGNEITTMYEIAFEFYGCFYTVYISPDEFESEWANYAMVEGEGDLFDSFNEKVEQDEIFEEIITQCKAFEVWKKELQESFEQE